jgi:hypothetical protein
MKNQINSTHKIIIYEKKEGINKIFSLLVKNVFLLGSKTNQNETSQPYTKVHNFFDVARRQHSKQDIPRSRQGC